MIQAIGCSSYDGVGTLFLERHAVNTVLLGRLLAIAVKWLREHGAKIVRAMDHSESGDAALCAAGFRKTADVIHLEAPTVESQSAQPVRYPDSLLKPHPLLVKDSLVDLVAETYVDSARLTDQTSLSSPEQDLRDHLRHSGEDGHWWTLHRSNEEIGVLLTGTVRGATVDLLYIGITKTHRNRELGRLALKEAFHFLSTHGTDSIVTQVDAGNEAAIRCYAAVGFHELSRSKLYVFQNNGNACG